MNDLLKEALFLKLKSLIEVQSEGEWDDALIEKDARHFCKELLPLFEMAANKKGKA